MNLTSNGWIDKAAYKEFENVYENRNIIVEELNKILDSNMWPIYNNYNSVKELLLSDDYKPKKENKIYNVKEPCWRLFFIMGKQEDGFFYTKKHSRLLKTTIKLLKISSSKIRGAVFSLFEPGYKIDLHRDNDGNKHVDHYRVHIPLIIPDNNNKHIGNTITINDINNKLCIFQLENDYRLWKDDDWFILNPNYLHSAWNYTDKLRIILIIDIFKN